MDSLDAGVWGRRIFLGIIFGIVAIILGLTIGYYADKWATSRFYKEREANLAKAAEMERKALEYQKQATIHAENEVKLAAENEILKKANEAQAALLDKSGSDQVKRDAEQIEQNAQKLQAKLNSINSTEDDQQVSELCKEANAANVKFSFCK